MFTFFRIQGFPIKNVSLKIAVERPKIAKIRPDPETDFYKKTLFQDYNP